MNKRICSIKGCGRKLRSSIHCGMHHARLMRGGVVGSPNAKNIRHGLSNHPLYHTWEAMRQRCSDPSASNYPLYGGRGITICKRWDDFTLFIDDMGDRPIGMTLDRKDVNGNYDPENCHWATRSQQATNTRPKFRDKRNVTGHVGVRWNSQKARYQATIQRYGKSHHLGFFIDINKAISARKKGELKYYGI